MTEDRRCFRCVFVGDEVGIVPELVHSQVGVVYSGEDLRAVGFCGWDWVLEPRTIRVRHPAMGDGFPNCR